MMRRGLTWMMSLKLEEDSGEDVSNEDVFER